MKSIDYHFYTAISKWETRNWGTGTWGIRASVKGCNGGLLGGARGAVAPPADFLEVAPNFKKGAKNFMKFDGSITFFSSTT